MTEHRLDWTQATCGKCGRAELKVGECYAIEACWNRDDEPEAFHYLAALKRSRSKKSRERYADLVHRLDFFARTGTLKRPRELNTLSESIDEIKTRYDRLPFYRLTAQRIIRVTHGFTKQTQKTPMGKIDKAHAIMAIDKRKGEGGTDGSL